jgi:hypothetical protein
MRQGTTTGEERGVVRDGVWYYPQVVVRGGAGYYSGAGRPVVVRRVVGYYYGTVRPVVVRTKWPYYTGAASRGEYGARSGTTLALEGGISRAVEGDTADNRRVVPDH